LALPAGTWLGLGTGDVAALVVGAAALVVGAAALVVGAAALVVGATVLIGSGLLGGALFLGSGALVVGAATAEAEVADALVRGGFGLSLGARINSTTIAGPSGASTAATATHGLMRLRAVVAGWGAGDATGGAAGSVCSGAGCATGSAPSGRAAGSVGEAPQGGRSRCEGGSPFRFRRRPKASYSPGA
jgi:hypothetical protein